MKEEPITNDYIINNVELASNLAHNAARDEMMSETSKGDFKINSEEEMCIYDEDNDCLIYTEQVQEVFNRWYDFYYDEIEKVRQKK